MKSILVVLMLLPSLAFSGPYFRLIDPSHIHKVAGVLISPESPKETSVGSAIALITHSVADGGCILPSVMCEDWSPLMAGLSVNAGRVKLSLGPGWNLTPLMKLGLFHLLNNATNEDSLLGVKNTLSSQPVSGTEVSVSFGPALSVAPIENGVFLPVMSWRGRFMIFAGAALKF